MTAIEFRLKNKVRHGKCCWTCGWSNPCDEYVNRCEHPDAPDDGKEVVYVEDSEVCDKWEVRDGYE